MAALEQSAAAQRLTHRLAPHHLDVSLPTAFTQQVRLCTRSSANPYYAFQVWRHPRGFRLCSGRSFLNGSCWHLVHNDNNYKKKQQCPRMHTHVQCKFNGQVKCDCAATPGAPGPVCASYQVNGKWIGSSRCERQLGKGGA